MAKILYMGMSYGWASTMDPNWFKFEIFPMDLKVIRLRNTALKILYEIVNSSTKLKSHYWTI